MVQCTVAGERDLPEHEMNELKSKILSLFPKYWKSLYEFEEQWKSAQESIGQACKRLRSSSKKCL
jgi:hypothetical protein